MFGRYSSVEFLSLNFRPLKRYGNKFADTVVGIHPGKVHLGGTKKILTQHDKNGFLHTLIFFDECQSININDYQAETSGLPCEHYTGTYVQRPENVYPDNHVDYINVIQYKDIGKQLMFTEKVGSHHEEIPRRRYPGWIEKKKRGMVFCQLSHCQRSCQEILDLAYYLNAHNGLSRNFAHHVESAYSFKGNDPKWLEVKDVQSFVTFIQASFDPENDLMILCDNKKDPEIKKLCQVNKWRYSFSNEATGSEASTVILYDLQEFNYEIFTRARNELIIITTPKGTKLKPILEEIKNGIHHDRHCTIYNKLCKKFGYGEPPACKYKYSSEEISKLIQPIYFNNGKIKQPILSKGKVEVRKNQSEESEWKVTKDLDQKSQIGTLQSVHPSQKNIVLKEDKSIENVRRSIEMLKKQEEEAREKAKQMQQMLEALQKKKREQIETQFMSYMNKISKEAFDEAVEKIKDDDLTLESVLLEIKSLELRL